MLQYFSKILYILSGRKRQLVILLFLILFSSVLETFGIGLVGPFIALATNLESIRQTPWSNWLYSRLELQSDVQFISIFGLGLVAVLFSKALLSFGITKYIFDFGFGQQAQLRAKLMRLYLQAPYTFHLSNNTAQLIQNVLKESESFASRVLMPLLFSCANLVIVLSLLVLLFVTDIGATSSILFVLLLIGALLYRFRRKLSLWGKESYEADVEMIRAINHGLGGLKDTKIIGCEDYFEEQVLNQAERFKRSVASANVFSSLPRFILEPVLIAFLVGFSIVYLITDRNPQSLTATLSVFGMAAIRLLPAASNLMQSLGYLKNSTYTVHTLHHTIRELEKLESYAPAQSHLSSRTSSKAGSSRHPIAFEQEIRLDQLTYRYPNTSSQVLHGVSLEIKKGQSVALIGKSGSGKTTLVDVLLGLLTPESGDICVDGVSIYEDLRAWQDLIAYIPQSIFLVDDTIERNIAFGVPDNKIDAQQLERAIQAAQLSELVEQLPLGVNTHVGERGIRLSGGQRQRIGIARALYHGRAILVLDEATAALDNETEALVTESIKSLSGTKTMIIIAHRLSTIEHCDRVYVLDKGHVVNSGKYEEVVTS